MATIPIEPKPCKTCGSCPTCGKVAAPPYVPTPKSPYAPRMYPWVRGPYWSVDC